MEWIGIAALVAAIVFAISAFFYSRQALTAANVTALINGVPAVATEVDKAATIVVNAYEQARRKGKLEYTPDLATVTKRVRSWLPEWVTDAVTDEQIVDAINSAILLASEKTNAINAAKATIAAVKRDGGP